MILFPVTSQQLRFSTIYSTFPKDFMEMFILLVLVETYENEDTNYFGYTSKLE